MRHLLTIPLLLLSLAGCYPGLQTPAGSRARLILAPTAQMSDQKQPPGIYVYKDPSNCSGIQRPDYPTEVEETHERPYTIAANQPVAIGWHSDLTGQLSMRATQAGVVIPGRGTTRMCSNTLTFTPVDGETYRVSDARVSEGCRFELTDSAGRPVPHVSREMWAEARKDGSHCERLPGPAAAR